MSTSLVFILGSFRLLATVAGNCPTGYTYQNGGCRGNYLQCPGNSYCYRENGAYVVPYCCQHPAPYQTSAQQPQIYAQTGVSGGGGGGGGGSGGSGGQSYSYIDFVRNQVQTYPLLIFAKSTCGYCQRVHRLLSSNYPHYPVQYFNVDTGGDGYRIFEAAQSISGMKTVPQIWLCQQLIGGADALQNLEMTGQLRSRLQSCFSRYSYKR